MSDWVNEAMRRQADEIDRLRDMVSNQKDTIDRLRAELAESERKHVLRLEGHVRTDSARAEAEAAIARVRAVLADPPVPSRMLIPVIREALDGAE